MKRHHFIELAQNSNGQPIELSNDNFSELVVLVYPDKTQEQISKYKKIMFYGAIFERGA